MPPSSLLQMTGITLVLLGGLTLLCGLWLMLAPNALMALSQRLNRWHSTERLASTLNRRIHWERLFYRHHRGFGLFLLLGSLYILYRQFGADNLTVTLPPWAGHPLATWLLSASRLFALIGALLTLAVGAIVFQRPSLLKGLEQASNRWIETEKPLEAMSDKHIELDAHLNLHARTVGALITLGSAYIIFIASPMIH